MNKINEFFNRKVTDLPNIPITIIFKYIEALTIKKKKCWTKNYFVQTC